MLLTSTTIAELRQLNLTNFVGKGSDAARKFDKLKSFIQSKERK